MNISVQAKYSIHRLLLSHDIDDMVPVNSLGHLIPLCKSAGINMKRMYTCATNHI